MVQIGATLTEPSLARMTLAPTMSPRCEDTARTDLSVLVRGSVPCCNPLDSAHVHRSPPSGSHGDHATSRIEAEHASTIASSDTRPSPTWLGKT